MARVNRRPQVVPEFANEDEERDFWATHDSTDFLDWHQAEQIVLANLHPTTRTISIRLPESMIERLKLLANQRDIPYQSLLKTFVAEKLEEALGPANRASRVARRPASKSG